MKRSFYIKDYISNISFRWFSFEEGMSGFMIDWNVFSTNENIEFLPWMKIFLKCSKKRWPTILGLLYILVDQKVFKLSANYPRLCIRVEKLIKNTRNRPSANYPQIVRWNILILSADYLVHQCIRGFRYPQNVQQFHYHGWSPTPCAGFLLVSLIIIFFF